MYQKLKALIQTKKIKVIYTYDQAGNFLIIPQVQYDQLDDMKEASKIWDIFGATIDEQTDEFDTHRQAQHTSFAGALASFIGKKEAA